jgi:hypothetical protein
MSLTYWLDRFVLDPIEQEKKHLLLLCDSHPYLFNKDAWDLYEHALENGSATTIKRLRETLKAQINNYENYPLYWFKLIPDYIKEQFCLAQNPPRKLKTLLYNLLFKSTYKEQEKLVKKVAIFWDKQNGLERDCPALFYWTYREQIAKIQAQPIAQPSAIRSPSFVYQPNQNEIVTASVETVNITEINQRVHGIILGATGSGKSTIATWLAMQLNGDIVVLDPHATPDDWNGLEVIGAGRNYATIADFMRFSMKMMNDRYEERNQGKKKFNQLTIIVDEFPAIAASKEAGKICKEWLKTLAREARKVGMKLLILTQGAEVKSMGIEGEGSLRASFCYLRLGELAIAHAKSLKDDHLLTEVKRLKRPCMIDDAIAILPEISQPVLE